MRVLFLHAVNYLDTGIPQGIAILSAVLKREKHMVDVFDTTFLKPRRILNNSNKMVGAVVYKKTKVTLEDLVENDEAVDIADALSAKLTSFAPDLLAVSTMTSNYDRTISLLKKIKVRCPTIIGGVHPTLCPEDVIAEKTVDMICIGEGEEALTELCTKMEKGEDYSTVRNLWVKKKGQISRNACRPFVSLDSLPCPDWSGFDQRHLFRPFMGKIYKGNFYLSSRGCPCNCTYCVNKTLKNQFRACGQYVRFQKPETTSLQLRELRKRYGATWFKFGDDNFLLQKESTLVKLCEGLIPLNIKFGCSVRPNTITESKIALAKKMGCVAMSIGIETGNENLRRSVLNRQISNAQIETAFHIVDRHKIRISTFNLIGIPNESREDVFQTIRLNRKLGVKAANVYILYPFPGTQIAQEFKTNHKKNGAIIPMENASVFHLSEMAPSEVEGLKKTFNLYLCLPEELWPIIALAEGNSSRSKRIYSALNAFATKTM
jgi:radical SAM superfamily enzyme YgiQ (UPF0313 family)